MDSARIPDASRAGGRGPAGARPDPTVPDRAVPMGTSADHSTIPDRHPPSATSPSSAAARDFYLAYLNSPAWRVTRNRALRLANWRCRRCEGKRDLQVHHLTYERLGREWDQDLEVLCDSCHRGEHLEVGDQGPLGIYLRLARVALRAEPFHSFADLSADVKALCARHRVPADPYRIERALGLLGCERLPAGESHAVRLSATKVFDEPIEAPPCSCESCVAAGVSTLHLRRDPLSLAWLHGEDLRRWYAAREAHYAFAAGRTLIKAWPGPSRTPAEHEAIVREQVKEHQALAYQQEREDRRRRSLRAYLEEVFAS
jgi:hypothetical protein